MKLPTILFKGSLEPSHISVKVRDSVFVIDNNYRKYIDNTWEALLEESKKQNTMIWNSTTYRLVSHYYRKNKLTLSLELIDYKTRIGINKNRDIFGDLGTKFYSKGLFIASIVKTSDGMYVMVELTTQTLNSNAIDFVGGTLSRDEMTVSSSNDIFTALNRELFEEVSISQTAIRSQRLIGIILNEVTQVGLYFATELNIDSSKIKKEADSEIKSVLILTRTELLKTLNSMKLSKKMVLDLIDDL